MKHTSLINLRRACAALAILAVASFSFSARAADPETKPADKPVDKPTERPAAPAQPAERGPGGGPRRGGGGGETPSVEASMKGMNRSLRALRAAIGDASKQEEALRLVGELQRYCIAAKNAGAPGDVLSKAKDDAARAAMKRAYRADLIALTHKLLECEQHIVDGKADAANAALTAVVELRDKAHKAMGIKDE